MAWLLMGPACRCPAVRASTPAATGALPVPPHPHRAATSGRPLEDRRLSLFPPLHSSLRPPLSRRLRANSSGSSSSSSGGGRSVARVSGENGGAVTEWEPFVEALRHHHKQPLEPRETRGHTRPEDTPSHPHSHSPPHSHSHSHSHSESLGGEAKAQHSHSHAPAPSHGHEHSHQHSHSHDQSHSHEHSHGNEHSHERSHSHSHEHSHSPEHSHQNSHAHSHKHSQPEEHRHGHSHGQQQQHHHHHHDHDHAHVQESSEHSHAHAHAHEQGHKHEHAHAHKHEHAHQHEYPHETNGHAHEHAHQHERAHETNGHARHSHSEPSNSAHSHSHSHQHQHQHQHAHSHPPAPAELQEVTPGTPTQPVLAPQSLPVTVAPRRTALVTLDPSWRARGQPLEANAGAGKVLFVDAHTAGVAGDMMVAALLDLGVPPEVVGSGLEGLGMDGFTCHVTTTERSAISATRFVVQEVGPQPFRDYGIIRRVLQHQSTLPPGAAAIALSAFRLLAEAEASVHGVPVDSVHFHEVGAIDSIVDIAACAIALDYLGWRPSSAGGVPGAEGPPLKVAVSRLPMGRGIIRGAAHGPLPCPAPATLDVLCRCGVPTFDAGMNGELVTPTGACLVGALVNSVTSWPAMVPERAAYGAGTKSWADRPNLLRLVLGTPLAS